LIAVDASAVLAILLLEPDAQAFRARLRLDGGVMSPVNHWEVLVKAFTLGGDDAVAEARQTMAELGIEIAAISEGDSVAAFQAFTTFGKGRGGPLNLGDCFAYALAQSEGDGLLFKGDDFPKTDVKPAI
jgi:ribonuclease VapC